MSNIVLLIIILGKVEAFTYIVLLVLLIYAVALVFIMIGFYDGNYDNRDMLEYMKDMMKKFKVKTLLVIMIIIGIVSILIPKKGELVLYYGSKLITTQNYHIAKDELLGFVKDIKNEIQNR